jgi:hypothetical protein
MRLLLLAFFLLLTPCLAVPEGIEGFRFGGSADEIVARIGEPTAIEGPRFEKSSKAWVWIWDYTRYGALFEVQSKTKDGTKSIRSLTIVTPCPWKLASGLGIGDSAAQIMQSYSNVKKPQDTLWFAPSSDRRNVTGFELAGSRIKSIFIGAMSD